MQSTEREIPESELAGTGGVGGECSRKESGKIGRLVKLRREGRRWEAGHTHHSAGLCGRNSLQLTAVGAKVKRLQPATWCVPSGSSLGWKPGVGKAMEECGQNFLEKAVIAAVYDGEGELGDSPTLR
jgi:hypothetical protein